MNIDEQIERACAQAHEWQALAYDQWAAVETLRAQHPGMREQGMQSAKSWRALAERCRTNAADCIARAAEMQVAA